MRRNGFYSFSTLESLMKCFVGIIFLPFVLIGLILNLFRKR